jgi:hypothetical protein
VNSGRCLPRSRVAARLATLPSGRSVASIRSHRRLRSAASCDTLPVCSVSFTLRHLPCPPSMRIAVCVLAGPMGFEPTTSDVTGRRSNRAELRPRLNHPLLHFPPRGATESPAEGRKTVKNRQANPARHPSGAFGDGTMMGCFRLRRKALESVTDRKLATF